MVRDKVFGRLDDEFVRQRGPLRRRRAILHARKDVQAVLKCRRGRQGEADGEEEENLEKNDSNNNREGFIPDDLRQRMRINATQQQQLNSNNAKRDSCLMIYDGAGALSLDMQLVEGVAKAVHLRRNGSLEECVA